MISRGGIARALTADHKPNRQDECARVEAAGGKVLHKGGSHRVMGLLAMSRAIGDHFLRPFIVADPEVSCHLRQLDDEVLLIATDGLWDVFTNDDAMALAIRCVVCRSVLQWRKHAFVMLVWPGTRSTVVMRVSSTCLHTFLGSGMACLHMMACLRAACGQQLRSRYCSMWSTSL